MNIEFDLLLKLKELESETNFHFVIDKDNAEIYLFEPNSKEYFDKINIQKELKEAENANPIKQPDSTRVERYTRNVIGRIRGIIQERERIEAEQKLQEAVKFRQEAENLRVQTEIFKNSALMEMGVLTLEQVYPKDKSN